MTEDNIEWYLQQLKIDIDILNERKNEKLKILEILESIEENIKDTKSIDEYLN